MIRDSLRITSYCTQNVFCFRLTAPTGVITDGTSNYTIDNKCTWLIESTPVLPVRLKFDEFITECSWDHLYVFDGSSIYDPLMAVFR